MPSFSYYILIPLLFISGGLHALDQENTIVFVHGFMRSESNMSALARSFEKSGFHTVNWGYPSREKYIEEHGADLVRQLIEIASLRPGEPIHFVTHSMGGLVIRAAINHPLCPKEALMGRVVLIAPPNKGSLLARKLSRVKLLRNIFKNKSGKQLMTTPHGGFESLGNFPTHMPVLVISGTAGFNPLIRGYDDGKVAVSETCLSTPHAHETVFSGHSWICHSPATIKKARRFIMKVDNR